MNTHLSNPHFFFSTVVKQTDGKKAREMGKSLKTSKRNRRNK
jgi:hypothetical protein